jgi:type IV secretory pathway VirB3-like protein
MTLVDISFIIWLEVNVVLILNICVYLHMSVSMMCQNDKNVDI